jgi:alkylation response protein AidB-like acyl-CoA dehydrogenase
MDFTFPPEQEDYRAKMRAILEKNSAEAFGRKGDGPGTSTASLLDARDDHRWSQLLDYHRRLYRDGLVALHWPKEFGGGGATMIEQAIYQDEALRLGLPLYGANQLAIDRIALFRQDDTSSRFRILSQWQLCNVDSGTS